MDKSILLRHFSFSSNTFFQIHQTLVVLPRFIHAGLVVCFGVFVALASSKASKVVKHKYVTRGQDSLYKNQLALICERQ